jgi:hypothetical protein
VLLQETDRLKATTLYRWTAYLGWDVDLVVEPERCFHDPHALAQHLDLVAFVAVMRALY